MTTLAEARAELVAALATAGLSAYADAGEYDPPFVYVRGDGIPDPSHVVRGTVESQWVATCVAGGWDQQGTAADLDATKLGVLTALRSLAGWRLGPVSRDGIRRVGGADLLTADVSAFRHVDI